MARTTHSARGAPRTPDGGHEDDEDDGQEEDAGAYCCAEECDGSLGVHALVCGHGLLLISQ
ncbi:hypothetical protein I4J28_10730 [Corynebacterium belfantii]|uniref:hypothetical protein n=1 Tax=Corynebacterium belfantii TaxID=2014537 RepID=UPI0018C93D38|nr:hypothetical protein [Corynebacterium belfantii]MBG9259840.1 hypothetical protein [Corynebacterium belfantii]MBG9299581.1 hypothetical protein [Corynebacterium belfantii]MBG9307972.1 hypothetical protein [Corynebacterium belfantii]